MHLSPSSLSSSSSIIPLGVYYGIVPYPRSKPSLHPLPHLDHPFLSHPFLLFIDIPCQGFVHDHRCSAGLEHPSGLLLLLSLLPPQKEGRRCWKVEKETKEKKINHNISLGWNLAAVSLLFFFSLFLNSSRLSRLDFPLLLDSLLVASELSPSFWTSPSLSLDLRPFPSYIFPRSPNIPLTSTIED